MVWAYIKEIAEKAEEKENTSEILQKLNKQIPQMAEVPSLNGTPIAAGSSVDTQKVHRRENGDRRKTAEGNRAGIRKNPLDENR